MRDKEFMHGSQNLDLEDIETKRTVGEMKSCQN